LPDKVVQKLRLLRSCGLEAERLMVFVMITFYGIVPGVWIAMHPLLVVFLAGVMIAVGMWMAGINVEYRDVEHVLPFMLQLWMLRTPVIYPISFVPVQWRWLLMLNPLTIVGGFRWALPS
jgi:lipopolysaccharide transport system permease protein